MPKFAQITADQADWSASSLYSDPDLAPSDEFMHFLAVVNPIFMVRVRAWSSEAFRPTFMTRYLVAIFGMLETAQTLEQLSVCDITFQAFMKADIEVSHHSSLVCTDLMMRRIRDNHTVLYRFVEQAMEQSPYDDRLIQRCTALIYRAFEFQQYIDQKDD